MKRRSQHADETAVDYLRRVIGWIDYEDEARLSDLPNTEAVLDLFDLWHDYDTDLWSGILECIAEGDSPDKARAFVRKYKLPKTWTEDIRYALSCREPAHT